ncbi:MAG: hemerythrin [Rhodospirillales bacterium]|jgi:hemerythrin superfamily protein|nr:hemerythrin [Rhodospirillales bacterium]
MRGLAAFAGGAAAAFFASRMLPPFLAQAAGNARAAAGRDPFDMLAQDHRIILSLLEAMEHSPENATFTRTQKLLQVKRRLSAHALAEEDVIYPMLHDAAGAVTDVRHLYADHAEIKMHLHALEMMPKNDPSWGRRAGELRALVESHARQEEEIDFPKLRAALSERETRRMTGNMQREKALLL